LLGGELRWRRSFRPALSHAEKKRDAAELRAALPTIVIPGRAGKGGEVVNCACARRARKRAQREGRAGGECAGSVGVA